ncbi:MAG TPA: hypothetical protein VGH42_09325 [Verrucomicrobiae bacterium]
MDTVGVVFGVMIINSISIWQTPKIKLVRFYFELHNRARVDCVQKHFYKRQTVTVTLDAVFIRIFKNIQAGKTSNAFAL